MTGMPVDPPFRIERPKVQCLHNTSSDMMHNASGITHIVPASQVHHRSLLDTSHP